MSNRSTLAAVVGTLVLIFVILTVFKTDDQDRGSAASPTNTVIVTTTQADLSTTTPADGTSGPRAAAQPTVTAPDGTPLTGDGAELYAATSDVPTPTTTVPTTTTAPADASSTVAPATTVLPTTTTIPPSSLGVLEQAENFAREFYTVNDGETEEQWKARVGQFATASLTESLALPEFDSGISNLAEVLPLNEGTGEINDRSAKVTVMIAVSQYDNGELTRTEDRLITVVLALRDNVWLAADYYFFS